MRDRRYAAAPPKADLVFSRVGWLANDILGLDPANVARGIADPNPFLALAFGLTTEQNEGSVVR